MKPSILPLSSVAEPLVYDFFARRGRAVEEIRWKYFDQDFNRGRERGYVWATQDRVLGFIGMIPVGLTTPYGDRELMWTCDWFVENAEQKPGMGVLLLKKVYSSYALAGNVGGTIYTRTIVPRLATQTVDGASVPFHLALRAGVLLQKLERRMPFLNGLSASRLSQIPLRRSAPAKRRNDVFLVAGVHPGLERLFDEPCSAGCQLRQDAAFLEWHMRRPGVHAFSCMVGDPGAPDAGALLWCSDSFRPGYWYAAFRALPAAEEMLAKVIRAVVSRVMEQGAYRLSTITSHLDRPLLDLLKDQGFTEGLRQPLYIHARDEPDTCSRGFSRLSHLDADLVTVG